MMCATTCPASIYAADDIVETPLEVTVDTLASVSVVIESSAPATVVSLNRTQVAAQISGVISSIGVEVGDTVEADGILATINCADFQQILARDESQLLALVARRRLAREELDRALKLIKTRNISEEQLVQRQADFDSAVAGISAQKAQIALSRRQVSLCEIRSPFAGVVIQRPVSLGAYVMPGTPVVEVLDTNRLEVRADVPLDAIESLDRQILTFSAGGTSYPIKLRSVVPLVNEGTRSQQARLEFEGATATAGTPGRLVWTLPGLAIPAHLLVRRNASLGIFVVDGEHARFVKLIGALEGKPVQTDLAADTRIVIDGRHALEDGRKVIVEASH
ncbi:MAG: MexH family multidrug efflux RND transporter periplasmic adaptor subunit [marine bacterium B5-7]|nr:MAG: MexH family multidrug efflux RND transporter periplasmic adaptor subunit [marine bacterium B5-7]